MSVFDKLLEVVIPPPKPPVPYQVQVSCSLGKIKYVVCLYDVEHHCILIYCISTYIQVYIYVSIYVHLYTYT